MSCDGHRNLFFSQAGNTSGGDFSADDLDRVYQAGRNRPAKNPAEQMLAEAKTRLLFADMQAAGIKPPTHSKNGLPKKDAQMGYAATYDYLQAKGYFAKGGSAQFDQQATKQLLDAEHGHTHSEGEHEHEEDAQPAPETGSSAQQCPKCGQFMGEDHVCAVADENTQQGEEPGAVSAEPAPKAKRKKGGGKAVIDQNQAALEADADMSKEVAPERIEALATQSLEGVRLGGMDETDTQHSARFPVWQYIPRCGRCGRFMSTRNPVCNNPKCGMAGKKQYDPIGWPPAGAVFKKSRRRQPTQEDYAANRALPKATIKIQGRDGMEKEVTLERITADKQVEYSEYVGAHVPIKGIGYTSLDKVLEWEGQPSKRRRTKRAAISVVSQPPDAVPQPVLQVGQRVRSSTDGHEGYIVKRQKGGYAEISDTPGGVPTRATAHELLEPVAEPSPAVQPASTETKTPAVPQVGDAHPKARDHQAVEVKIIPQEVEVSPQKRPRFHRADQNEAILAAASASLYHDRPYHVWPTANGYVISDTTAGVMQDFIEVNGRQAVLYQNRIFSAKDRAEAAETLPETPTPEPDETGPGVQKCPKCGQFMGNDHTCPPENTVGMLNRFQALPRDTISRVYREIIDSADPAYAANRDDLLPALTTLTDLHDLVDSGSAELAPEMLDDLQRQLYGSLERNPEVAGMLSRGLSQMESKDIAAAVALSGEDAGPGVQKCPRCGQFMGQDHDCAPKDVKAYGWSQVKEWVLEQDRQNGNNGHNFFAAYSLMEGNYEQVIRDAHRGRITADRAIEIVDRLGEVGAITESNRLWYAEQIDRNRPPETPPAPAPDAVRKQYQATFQSEQNGRISLYYPARDDEHAAWQAENWARRVATDFGDKIAVETVDAYTPEEQPANGAKRVTADEYAGMRQHGYIGRNNGQTYGLYQDESGNTVWGPVEVVINDDGPGAQKCPKCGQFMGESHVCPYVSDEEYETEQGKVSLGGNVVTIAQFGDGYQASYRPTRAENPVTSAAGISYEQAEGWAKQMLAERSGKGYIQKCPKCGQFMGEDHVCPVTDEAAEKTLGDYIVEPEDEAAAAEKKAEQDLPPLQVGDYIPDEPEKTVGDYITEPEVAEQPAQTPVEAPVTGATLPRDLNVNRMSLDEYQGIERAAMDWKYLTVAGGGMARKSDLDEYLMAQFNLTQMAAREVTNSLDRYDHFRTGEGGVFWNEVEAGRPAPKWEDHPELAPPGGYMEGAKLLQKCPKCGQFMGEDHTCPPTAEEIEQQRLASLPPLHAITDIALKRGDGWVGNKAMEGEFVVDGFTLLVADDIKDRKLREQLSKPPKGMEQTVTQETVAGIYYKSDSEARIPAEVYGYVDKPSEDDYEKALIVSANGVVRAVDARKLARLGASLDYAQVTMSEERGAPIVFRKEDGRAVALLMPLYMDDDKLPSADDLLYQRSVLSGEIPGPGAQKCPKCGQFMGKDHVCPVQPGKVVIRTEPHPEKAGETIYRAYYPDGTHLDMEKGDVDGMAAFGAPGFDVKKLLDLHKRITQGFALEIVNETSSATVNPDAHNAAKAAEVAEIEAEIQSLALGNDDVRHELLRKRNILLGGDPNKLDQQLDKEYYDPQIEHIKNMPATRTVGAEPYAQLKPAVNENPNGTFSVVGTVPAYLSNLVFEDRELAQMALDEGNAVLERGEGAVSPAFRAAWQQTQETGSNLVRAEDLESVARRCGNCGAFMPAEGPCNNPKCPSNNPVEAAEVEAPVEAVETPVEQPVTVEAAQAPAPAPVKTAAPPKDFGFRFGEGSSHTYIPKWMKDHIPPIGSTQNDDNPYAVIKLFTPDSNWTWYVTEYDGNDTCFGLVAGHETEWGYFSLSEISSVRGPLGLRIEREKFTKPTRVKALREYKEAWGGDYEEEPEAPAEPVAPVLTEEIKSTPITPQTYTIRAEPDPLTPDKQVYRAYDTNGNPLDIGGDTPAEVDERLRQSLPVTDVMLEGEATGPGSQKCPKCGRFMGQDHVCPVTEEVDEADADLSAPVDEPVPDVVDPFAVEEESIVEEAPRGPDYTISDADEVGKGGAKTKARNNVAAVRLVKQLEDDGRMATPEEQATLVKFVGWGGLPQVFDWKNESYERQIQYGSTYNRSEKPEFYDEWKELKGLLSEEEWDAARKSTMNAHYTSPTVVRGVWKALEHMGFDRTNGLVLEPAAGIGHFFGLMPEKFKKCRKVGVELDPFTARIAKHLYQGAEVQNCGFEDAALPDDFVDLAISNVPFGAYGVVDKEFRGPLKFLSKSIHNFFFAKALRKVKPGGVVAFITSRYTLDGQDTQIREHLAKEADLVGAIRLPNTAFKENAGTEVTTDIIFLRKRGKGEPPSDTSWVDTQKIIGADGNEIRVNDYYAEHPEMMLGELKLTGSMYARKEVTLESDGREISEALEDAISRLPTDALASPAGHCPQCGGFMGRDGMCHNPNCHTKRPLTHQPRMADRGRKENEFVVGDDGQLYRVHAGQLLSPDDPMFDEVDEDGKRKKKSKQKDPMAEQRARGMVAVNAVARKLLQINAQADDEALQAAQAELSEAYDAFVAQYGPITAKANQNALQGDPNLPFLLALEDDYNSETKTAKKTAIFTKRTIAINKPVEHADSPVDALRVALDEGGAINWARMEALTGRPADVLQRALLLQGAVYQAPDGTWQTSEEYLSGNVREKLRQAQAAAKLDPRYQRNVEALQEVLPRDLEAGEIKAALGSAWIPTTDVRDFAEHLFDGAEFTVEYNPAMAEWAVKPEKTTKGYSWNRRAFDRTSAKNREIWGTQRVDALTLLKQALNAQTPTVTDEGPDGKRVVNENATIAAREAQAKIKKEFESWLFSDPERSERLLKKYNEEFNSEVPRAFDGSHLSLPGMGATMPDLRKHQKDAIWRITQGGNTLLAHVVGAGKTFSMIGGGMELRRMGLRKKVMYTVPNHMLEQFAADIYRMYPAANVLTLASGDLTAEKRAEAMSRVATGDYDAVVVTHSAFAKLPVSAETQTRYLREQLDDLEEALEAAKEEGEKITVKKMEKAKAKYEAKIKGLQADMAAKQDQTITWDDLGVDQLFVDEADQFKNLDFPTRRNISGVKGASSQRAFDMYTKIRAMGDKFGHGRGVCFATGTPIANSVSEMYNMQRYLDYQNLKDKGLAHFDAWANQFGESVTSIEMKPSGGGYQTKERFAQFNNVPELKRMFMRSADIRVDPRELGLKRPELKADERGDRRQRGVVAPSTPELKSYISSLVDRADKLGQVDPHEDNMLKITGDGRKAALDMRLVDPYADDNPDSKLNKCVAGVFDVYQKTTGVEVPGEEGKQNMAQMVFCDLGTPAAREDGGFCVYDDIKAKLIARGVPADEIAFMQDHKSDEAKFELFQNVNAGKVRVLIGSTETMGSGTNAQRRLAALHHLDAPWRPRDIDQREGRILRQGNMNQEVGVYRYLTEGSFDVYNWQLLERKSRFISQVMNRSLNERSVEDIDAQALTYAEMKALATGNPAVIERVAVDTELRKLNALEAAAKSRGHSMRAKLEKLPQDIAHSRAALKGAEESHAAVTRARSEETQREEKIKADIEKARTWARETAKTAKEQDTPENKERAENAKAAADGLAARFKRNGAFKIRLNGRDYDEREDAGKTLVRIENDLMSAGDGKDYAVGEYLGFPLVGRAPDQKGGQAKFFVKITGHDAEQVQINTDYGRTFDAASDGTLHISRLNRVLDKPAKNIEEHKGKITGYESELANLQGAAGGGFEYQERLEYLRKRSQELDEILAGLGSDKQVLGGGESGGGESDEDE